MWQMGIFCFMCCFLLALKKQTTTKKEKQEEKRRNDKAKLCSALWVYVWSLSWKGTDYGGIDRLVRAGARCWPQEVHNKNTLWGFPLRILNIFGNKGNICLIFLSLSDCYSILNCDLKKNIGGIVFCGIVSASSKCFSQAKFWYILMPFHFLKGYIVSYIPAHLSCGSEQSQVCLIKMEPPYLL